MAAAPRHSQAWRHVAVALIVLVVVASIALAVWYAGRGATPAAAQAIGGAAALALAGTLATRQRRPCSACGGMHAGGTHAGGGAIGGTAPVETPPHSAHPAGNALWQYARDSAVMVGVHPLDQDGYTAPDAAAVGGGSGAVTGGKKTPAAKKPWREYATWKDLREDEGAVSQYLAERAAALSRPDFDWGPVLAEMVPKLTEKHEYIGLVDVDPAVPGGKTLKVVAVEASPVEAGTLESEVTFASVPSDMVQRVGSRPALFIFHTHPDGGNPLPSSADLSCAIVMSAHAEFAASAVVSRYGVLVYALEWSGYKTVHDSSDWTMAMLHMRHDVTAAHEAIRSWAPYRLADVIEFYRRHQLWISVVPSPHMVGDGQAWFKYNIEAPVDYEMIDEAGRDAREHRKTVLAKQKTQPSTKAIKHVHWQLTPGITEDVHLD